MIQKVNDLLKLLSVSDKCFLFVLGGLFFVQNKKVSIKRIADLISAFNSFDAHPAFPYSLMGGRITFSFFI
jgi:hypothetical protein